MNGAAMGMGAVRGGMMGGAGMGGPAANEEETEFESVVVSDMPAAQPQSYAVVEIDQPFMVDNLGSLDLAVVNVQNASELDAPPMASAHAVDLGDADYQVCTRF